MPSPNYIRNRREALLRQLEELDRLEQEQKRFEGIYGLTIEGTIIAFEYQFIPGGPYYSYAAIRAGGKWSTTGPRSPKSYSSVDLVRWLSEANDVHHLRRMTDSELL